MNTFLHAKWQNLIMANYEIDPSILFSYLPKGVELDYFNGKTYVSLVGFLFKDSSIFNIPIPSMGTFEEVNLRFYVVRKVGDQLRRGVVFINETVPNKIVAWVANKLYKEHYIAIPTKHKWTFVNDKKEIEYQWKVQSKWNSIKVVATVAKQKMVAGSMEEFIFEHYFGYTKVNSQHSIEYKINHPSWEINAIHHSHIDCDFAAFYGKDFELLNSIKPHSIMLAEGSDISVDWKRISF
ncbi:MAG TPA: DUF2071 domain-containing protein [Bacteroidia bacterium]|nr:DUF2071 domain-containing protein [Bacteroidia bacterium]